jgi:dephospho-CoA kinase
MGSAAGHQPPPARSARRALRLGIVGSLGAGKTAVLQMLAELGAAAISADDVSRGLLQPGSPLLAQVIAAFGQDFLRPDGSLNRRALAELIFRDPSARQRLEAITHPPMVAEIKRRIERAEQAGAPVVAVEAANLYQMGAAPLVDYILRVQAGREERLRRLMQRDGLEPAQAEARLRLHEQLGLDEAAADFVLDTTGSLADTRSRVEALWRRLLTLRPRRPAGAGPGAEAEGQD